VDADPVMRVEEPRLAGAENAMDLWRELLSAP